MDWKVFVCCSLLYWLIAVGSCGNPVINSTFVATGNGNGLEIYMKFSDSTDVDILCIVSNGTEEIIDTYRINGTSSSLFNTSTQSHGYMSITLTCAGNVNFSLNSEEIYVGEAISGLEVFNASLTEPLLFYKPLTDDVVIYIVFETGTDVDIVLELMNSTVISFSMSDDYSGNIVNFTLSKMLFDLSGMYTIHVQASNLFGSEEVFAALAVQEAVYITNVDLLHRTFNYSDVEFVTQDLLFYIAPVIVAGDMLTYTMTISKDSNIQEVKNCCLENYWGITNCTTTTVLETTGIYSIQTHVSNYVSSYEVLSTVNFFTTFDRVFKNPTNAVTAKTNIEKPVQTTIDLAQFSELPHASIWQIYSLTGTNQFLYFDSLRTWITFPANTMDQGHYLIALTVNLMINGTTSKMIDYFFLNYTLPELLPAIQVNNVENFITKVYTGEYVEHVVLNTEHTIDPAQGLASVATSPMRQTMGCATWPSWDENTVLNIIADDRNIQSAENCEDLIQQVGDNFVVSADNVTENQWYIFNLSVTRSGRSSTFLQAVQPTSQPFPVASFQSVSNGYKTSSNYYKLSMSDLHLNVITEFDNQLVNQQVSYAWKFEMRSNDTLNYITVVDLTKTGNGFSVNKAMFQSWNGIYYRLSCTVSIEGQETVTVYRLFRMNLPPYGGTCDMYNITTPATAGKTDICITCRDWKDEGIRDARDPSVDHGGSLVYSPVQIFLTANGTVNETIPAYKHTASFNLERCVKLVRPPNKAVRTRVEILIQDELSSPHTTVTFDDIEIMPLSLKNSAEIYQLYDSYQKDLENALAVEDIALVTNIVMCVAADINIDVPVEPPTLPYANLDPASGNLVDVSPNGKAVSFDQLIDDLTLSEEDPFVRAIQETNYLTIEALHTITEIRQHSLTLQDLQALVQCVLMVSTTYDRNLNDTSLSMLENVTHQIFEVFDYLEDESAISHEIQQSIELLTNTLADRIAPDSLKNMEQDVSLAGQRKRDGTAALFMSPLFKELKDTSALMTEDERDFYMVRQLQKIKTAVTDKQDLADRYAHDTMEMQRSLVKHAKLSNGAETVIGDNSSFAKLTTELSKYLANKTLSAKTTSVQFPDANLQGNVPVNIGLFETDEVINIDVAGTAARITSGQTRLLLEGEGEIPDTIKFTQTIPFVEIETTIPLVDPGDASAFDYRIVRVNRPEDDLFILIKPTSERVEGYVVYLFYSDEEDEHVSKIQYKAKAESKYPNYIAQFPPSVRGSEIGGWKLGIETIFKDSQNEDVAVPLHKKDDKKNHVTKDDAEPKYPDFYFATATMACMTWDDSVRTWRTDECKGTWKPTTNELECECRARREITFANSFYVQPNTIDFSSVFLKFSPLNQAAVVATLVLVFITYIIVVIWARRQDRKDLLKWGITPLRDNFAMDNYFYELRVYTGIRPGAGTQSLVNFVVSAEELDTGIRELSDGVRHEFPSGSAMMFLMSTPVYLGDLEYIRIWHDNSGGSWYLSKIELFDIQRDETFTFLFEQWLSVDDGVLETVVPVSKDENLNFFRNRFVAKMKDNIADSHMLISIVYRPSASTFTRVQRASCALVFIMLTMISNAMFFRGSNTENYETPTEVQVGPFRFSLQQVYISFVSAFIVTPPTLLLIYLFRLSETKPKETNKILYKPSRKSSCCIPVVDHWLEREHQRSVELEKELILKGYPKLTGFTLPENFNSLAWIIVVAATVVSAFYIMLYSMEWGKQKSEEWISTFILSFLESVLCLDPIKILFTAIVVALIFRTMATPTVEVNRNTVMKNYTPEIRGRSNGIRMPAPPVDKQAINKARSKRQLNGKIKHIFFESIRCLLLIWILVSISYSSRDPRAYDVHQTVVDTFIEPKDTPAFTSIKSTKDFFNWMNKTFIVKAFPEHELGGNQTQLYWKYRAFIDGGQLLRVGPPRLRQLRTTKARCPNKYFGTQRCYKKYEILTEDTNSYCIAWENGPCESTEKLKTFSTDAWKFTPSIDILGAPVSGYYTTYGGGGYIAKLSVNKEISQFILDELHTNLWVDRQTRAVLIEFTLYCLNANIFSYNMFMVEFLETGGAFTFHSIIPLRVYLHLGPLGAYTLLCQVLFALHLVVHTAILVKNMIKKKGDFFKNTWNIYDLIFVVCGYIAVVLYIAQIKLVGETLQVFREDERAFVNFYHIAIWNQAFVLALGILVFMATIRMIQVLGYSKRIGTITKIFSKAANDLFWFGTFFLFFFTTYAVFGNLLFGSDLRSYKDILKSMETLFVSMLGKSRFAEIDDSDPVLSKIYFMIFIFFLVYMIMTMFLSILSEAIDDATSEGKKYKDKEMITYLITKLQRLVRFQKSNKNADRPKCGPQVSAKSLYRWKIVDFGPQEVLADIRDTMVETLSADSIDFKMQNISKDHWVPRK